MKWHKLTTLRSNDEERYIYFSSEFDFSWWGTKTPKNEEEVLVSDRKNDWIDLWLVIDYTVAFFEITDDIETAYWMSLPKPPKEVEEDDYRF